MLVSSVDVRIDVISARDGTYTVTCTTTGGTVLSGSLTGPAGLNIPLQPVGTVNRTGQDSYSATTNNRSGGSDGDTYQCTASNGVSSPDASGSEVLRGSYTNMDPYFVLSNFPPTFSVLFPSFSVASVPIINSANQIPPGNTIRVTWRQPIGGAPVISYRVYYSGGDDVGYMESSNTTVDIADLVNDGRIYTISVEALSLHLSGESSTMNVLLGNVKLLCHQHTTKEDMYTMSSMYFRILLACSRIPRDIGMH